jgi:hypothetical protein
LRVLVEAVVVVGSILLAFGIDSAWEARQDRLLETEYLEALLLDVERTHADSKNRAHLQARQAEELLALMEEVAAGTQPADTVFHHYPYVFILGESMDTYRDLVASGGTTRIRSVEVRRIMSRVQTRVDYVHNTEAWALDLFNSLRSGLVASGASLTEAQQAVVWASYAEIDEAVLVGHERLAADLEEAMSILRDELASR